MPSNEKKPCPICKLADQDLIKEANYGEKKTYHCARCGQFTITRTAEAVAERKKISHKLSAWSRARYEQKKDVVEIDSTMIESLEKDLPNYTPAERQLILLRNIELKSLYPGYGVELNRKFDYPLAWASCDEELMHYVLSLIERKLLRPPMGTRLNLSELEFTVEITSDGWNYLDDLAKNVTVSNQVFTAMSFSEEMKAVWENAIRPAITDAGYRPYRIDTEPHIDRIDVKIMSEIRNSRFIVADVTEQKHGVYFEAGYALGLKLPVIWSCKKSDVANVHFDTRQYNHILWSSEEDLKQQLFYYINAIIGKP